MTLDVVLDWDWDIKADVVSWKKQNKCSNSLPALQRKWRTTLMWQRCLMTGLCSKGTEMRSLTSSEDFMRQVSSIFFSLNSCSISPVHASCMAAALSTHWHVDDLPTGFFSHTHNSHREGVSRPAAPRKGPTPERTRGQDQKPYETDHHQLNPGSCSQGKLWYKAGEREQLSLHHFHLNDDECFDFKMPKRRVTWGGKMIRLARPSVCGSSDLSFADPVTRKRRADRSCLTELGEGKEEHSVCILQIKINLIIPISQSL